MIFPIPCPYNSDGLIGAGPEKINQLSTLRLARNRPRIIKGLTGLFFILVSPRQPDPWGTGDFGINGE
jgi:hypothetical protein